MRRETESLDDIDAYLQGHVFHVTKLSFLSSIDQDGEVKPNRDGVLQTTFGSSKNSYFRNRSCVSLFDYRPVATEEIKAFRQRCYPFQPIVPGNSGIAILILQSEAYDNLIPWTHWKDEKAWSEMIVPHVEIGYPGALPVRLIAEIISVEILENQYSFATQLRMIHKNRLLTNNH